MAKIPNNPLLEMLSEAIRTPPPFRFERAIKLESVEYACKIYSGNYLNRSVISITLVPFKPNQRKDI